MEDKVDQADEASPADRNLCLIDVPGPVKDAILQYLDICLISEVQYVSAKRDIA